MSRGLGDVYKRQCTGSMISTLTDSKGAILSVSDKVRDEEGFTWWVLSMFPEINSVVGITTNEDRFNRKAFRPEELTICDS